MGVDQCAGALWSTHDALQSVLPLGRKAGVWDRLLDAVSKRYDRDIVMIDSSYIRVHQHGANAKKGALPILAWGVLTVA